MLLNIKSIYFFKILFSYIKEINKLKLIIYNKSYQSKLALNTTSYKIFSNKYIIEEKNGKVKEFNLSDDKLVFEGEYSNGKRNGKGKEYGKYEKIIFVGEYLNGQRHGKGKEYDKNNYKLIFKGEYFRGKKWNGIGYDPNNKISYTLKKGKGYVKEYYYDNLIFEGEYLYGEKNGKGIEYSYKKSSQFSGEYLNGKRWNGRGYDKDGNFLYEIKDGKGFIKEKYYNGSKFEGEFLNGEKNGKGKEYDFVLGEVSFEGEDLNGKRHGKGKEYNYKGELKFEGEYIYDQRIKGKEYHFEYLEYEGEYLFDKKWNGKGFNSNGELIYELENGNGNVLEFNKHDDKIKFVGEYLNGKKHGKGIEYKDILEEEVIFEGEFLNGKRWNGKGKEYDWNGLVFTGEYLYGKRWKGIGKEYFRKKLIFEGDYCYGKRYNGYGLEFDDNYKIVFEGEYSCGLRKYSI